MPTQAHATPARRRWIRGSLLLIAVLLYVPLLEVVRVTAGPNFHEITPGQLYRSAQLSQAELRAAAQRFNLRSIINLRNACPIEPWYQDEVAVAQELGIQHYNLNFSAYQTPAPQELRKLVAILETCPRPVLIHCRRGADRTGLATSLAWLFDHPDQSAPTHSLLAMRYGHVGLGKVSVLNRVYRDYWDWLGRQGQMHSRKQLKQWVHHDYRPGQCWAKIEPVVLPDCLTVGQPGYARFRVHNLSHHAWTFHPSGHLGVHLRGYVEPEGAQPPPDSPQFTPPRERRRMAAGFFHATVPPGGSLDLEVALPAMPTAGRHTLFVDLIDEPNDCYFHMVGSTPFHTVLEARRGSSRP